MKLLALCALLIGSLLGVSSKPALAPSSVLIQLRGGDQPAFNNDRWMTRKRSNTLNRALAHVPNGGARVAAKPRTAMQKLLDAKSTLIPVVLCTLASVLYFVLFYMKAGSYCNSPNAPKLCNKIGTELAGGFCVTGAPLPSTVPAKDWQCKAGVFNSHTGSWQLDAALTLVAFFLPKLMGKEVGLPLRLGIAVTIFFHGLLHKLIGNGFFAKGALCNLGSGSPGGYSIYVFMLVLLVNLVCTPNGFSTGTKAVLTIVETFLLLQFGGDFQDWALSALFATSHLLVSGTSLLTLIWTTVKGDTPNSFITAPFGWSFLVATVAGLVEFLDCKFEHPIGGHIYYDLFLHISMITTLIGAQK